MRLRNIRGSKDVIASCPFVVQEPESCRGRWAEVFGNENPIHIEVGMGKGRFLMDMAVLHPEINYIGIEMYDSVLLRAVQKREKLGMIGQRNRAVGAHNYMSAFIARNKSIITPAINKENRLLAVIQRFTQFFS